MKRKKAFTLIEILVVVSIIALLVSILIPTLSKARAQVKRVSCASQLHQVSIAMMSYMQDSRDHMPWVSEMPSIDPAPLIDLTVPIYFADVLKTHLKNQIQALNCPGDVPGFSDRLPPNRGLTYFQSERSSYGYRTSLAGLTPQEFNLRRHYLPGYNPHASHHHDPIVASTVWFASDYNNFHGQEGTNGARRYVYIDGHVADYEN